MRLDLVFPWAGAVEVLAPLQRAFIQPCKVTIILKLDIASPYFSKSPIFSVSQFMKTSYKF